MLLRAYRMTDRLGVVTFKSTIALSELTLDGVRIAWRAIAGMVLAVVLVVWAVLRWLFRLLAAIARPVAGTSAAVSKSVVKGTGRASVRLAQSTATATNTAMARRAERQMARAQLKATVAEDPLRRQNRLLSGLVVALCIVVLSVVLWATDPSRVQGTPLGAAMPVLASDSASQNGNLSNVSANTAAGTPQPADAGPVAAAPTLPSLPTTVPTATPLPVLLEVRGSLAYTVRENGQTDVWAIPVGSRAPLRITNSPEDERDPAWSPDGKRLAYASRIDGNWEIYVEDMSTRQATRMTYDASFQGNPQWSPDGEWLVYESYQGNNLDIYVMRIDGSQAPLRLTDNPAPDFAPAWSPDGRRIAFVSWRDGNQDLYLFSLDDPRDEASVNITQSPARHENHPSWSPDGNLLAFSAVDEGVEKVFVKPVDDADAPAQVLERGRAPTWAPDGTSLVFAVDAIDSTHLVAGPFAGAGIATEIIPVPRGATDPVWTAAPLPPALVNSGGLPPAITEPLYIEQVNDPAGDPPYRLNVLNGISAPSALLSERVNDSFMALRERASDQIGWDFLGQLEDAFWSMDRLPSPGEERRNWLMAGRSVAINRNAIVGFPPPIEVVREDLGVDILWRIYVRVSDEAQSGLLGEPLRRMPWDFASRNQGDVEAYDNGGRLRAEMPSGYYVDLTQLALDYGWVRVPAGNDWRANFNSTNYWLFQKRDGLAWYDAMRELYTEAQLGGFAPRPTASAPRVDPLTQQTAATVVPEISSDVADEPVVEDPSGEAAVENLPDESLSGDGQ